MSRSVKKGPYIHARAPQARRKRVEREAREEGSSRPGRAPPRSSPTSWATPSPCTTAASTFRSISPRIWSATNSASSPPPALSGDTPAKERPPASDVRRRAHMATRVKQKTAARRAISRDKRPHAVAKYIRISSRKVKIVIDLIRGKQVDDALAILMYTPEERRAGGGEAVQSRPSPTLRTTFRWTARGCTWPRCSPTKARRSSATGLRSHGRADVILKRSSHITIVLDQAK